MKETPKIPTENKLFSMLRERRINEFIRLRESGEIGYDLRCLAFRGIDLRVLNADCLFYKELSAQEILMSVTHGTRLRVG